MRNIGEWREGREEVEVKPLTSWLAQVISLSLFLTCSEYFMTFKTHFRNQEMQLINLLAGQRIAWTWITVIKLIMSLRHHLRHSAVSKESHENIASLWLVINFSKNAWLFCPWRAGNDEINNALLFKKEIFKKYY